MLVGTPAERCAPARRMRLKSVRTPPAAMDPLPRKGHVVGRDPARISERQPTANGVERIPVSRPSNRRNGVLADLCWQSHQIGN